MITSFSLSVQLPYISKRSYEKSTTRLRHAYLFLFSQGIKHYRNTGGPPVETPSTETAEFQTPDHHISSGNQDDHYENPDNGWPYPYSEIQQPIPTHDPDFSFATSLPQRVETKETQYGNVTSVGNEAFESHGEEGEDVLDAHGYLKCVHARDAPEEPHKTYVNN